MQNEQRIPRRVVRRFLQLAAVAFAIGGADVPPAAAASGDWPEPSSLRGESCDDEVDETRAVGPYRHAFGLGAASAAQQPDARARIRVIDSDGRNHVQLALHGAGMIGPLAHGAYTVLVKVDGQTEVHRVRIGPDTLPWLEFSEPA